MGVSLVSRVEISPDGQVDLFVNRRGRDGHETHEENSLGFYMARCRVPGGEDRDPRSGSNRDYGSDRGDN
jgi:hypothetical protein